MSSDRRKRAMALLDSLGVDAVIITNGTNRRYLTGFTADDHAADELSGIVLLARDDIVLLAPSTNLPWAQAEALDGVSVLGWTPPFTRHIADLIVENGWQTVGFEDATTTFAVYNEIVSALADHGAKVELIPIGAGVDALRRVKSADELDCLRTALDMTDKAFVAASERARAGMTEKELADIVAEELKRAGSDGESFPTIVASGPNAAKPHHAPGDRVMEEGEPIIIDMGALHRGYAGDLTRTIWYGQPDEQLVTIYGIVKAAFDAAEAAAGPNLTGVDFDGVARSVFADHDMDQYFVHSLGHGLGLRVHEAPSASSRSRDTLEAGNVVTIEPGLYIPGWGGVRIEDVVVITENGSENLTRAPKRMMSESVE